MDLIREIARTATESLEIGPAVRTVLVGYTDSPWNEKALIKRRGDHLDVKITVWKDEAFLFGRVFRLFLYIRDVLDPEFLYNPKMAPEEHKEPVATARYNQIWSLYVDSRMEKRGIESFFDRTMRKNLFIDMEKGISWEQSGALFQELWARPVFTYPEILSLSRNLYTSETSSYPRAREVEINEYITSPHVRQHIERIQTEAHKHVVNEILSFAAYHCKDCYITSSYYGIFFLFQRRVFVELIPTRDGLLFLTFSNPSSEAYETETLSGNINLQAIQGRIKSTYDALAAQSRDVRDMG